MGPRHRSHDDGFTLVFFALAIVALMGIAALVVDLGYWYLHADRIQRAADSAALAGVVNLPGDPGAAMSEAMAVATANGFSSGVDVETETQDHSLTSTELKVSITDHSVPAFFAKVFGLDKISETRSSVATYQPPVPLGSTENSFGTGDLALGPSGSPTATPTNIWAAVNGYCTSKENGDEFLSAFDATFTGSGFDCPLPPNTITGGANDPNATDNYEYNPAGYIYDIETPDQTPNQAIGTPITVQAYDPSFNPDGCSSGGESPDNDIGQTGSQITTNFSLYYTPVPVDPPSAANQIGTTYSATTGDQTTCGMWVTIGQIPALAVDGTYQLEVASQADQANSDGTNAYGLRLYQGAATVPSPVANGVGPWSRCTTDTASPFYTSGTSYPVIQGQSALSVYVNASSTTGSFYLADVDPSYDGKVLEISLFDPGEGDHYIQILGPDGNPVPFSYTTTDACSSTNPVFPPAASGNTTDCASTGTGGIQFPNPVISGTSSDQGGEQDVLDVSGTITPPKGEESSSNSTIVTSS